MDLLFEISANASQYSDRNAFLINQQAYTYAAFAQVISNIRTEIAKPAYAQQQHIGLVANDDLETYASIIALWLEGKAYVPLSPEAPEDRNLNIIRQASLQTILDSSEPTFQFPCAIIASRQLEKANIDLLPKEVAAEADAYILFTSGTTGQPKGVPISRGNVSSFMDAFWKIALEITEHDKVLQMFDLTFDLSVMSYLAPLCKGACCFTIPKDKIKYSYIFELMEDHQLTVALMVPSVLHHLRPYFDEIHLPEMRYSLFCGEALPLDITEEWSRCLPNATIQNVYGPTEDTIFCTYYTFERNNSNKHLNGVLSIGKAMVNNITVIIDEHNNILDNGQEGQLCLGGAQLTAGYWRNDEKNRESFFDAQYQGKTERFYKTGDLCRSDSEGDILYVGRVDFQVKIQGFRVELTEIEFHAKQFFQKTNLVALAVTDNSGNSEIALAFETSEFDTHELVAYLKSKLPAYMLPKKFVFVQPFPLNVNGKTDRNKISKLIS